MNLNERIEAFSTLSDFLKSYVNDDLPNCPVNLKTYFSELSAVVDNLKIHNSWFIKPFVRTQLKSIAESTTKSKLLQWTEKYSGAISNQKSHKVGVVMAGNIPFVGFHDFISVLITGNKIIIKTSSKDEILPKFIAKVLCKIQPEFEQKITFVKDKLQGYEAIIATGSNNTSRYFEYYFGNVPNIIRKNRTSVAVLNGNETKEQLLGLADDIMLYFGLGCRNVSKIYVPENYSFDEIFESMFKYSFVINETKYANNFDYNRAIFLVNGDKFLENGFFIVKENFQITSPISVLFYETYKQTEHLQKIFKTNNDLLQSVVSSDKSLFPETFDFGKAQFPELWNYEDGIDTLEFLSNLE